MALVRLALHASIVLSLLLSTAASVVRAQDAVDRPAPMASQPQQPETGPGGPKTVFPAARGTKYGPVSGGSWIWEPTGSSAKDASVPSGSLPLIVHIHGCYPENSPPIPEEIDAWMKHLARQGYVIVAPVYRYGHVMEDVPPMLREALNELERHGHAEIDAMRSAVIGHSYGGLPAVLYAATAQAKGLPIPRAIFLLASCAHNGYCLDLPKQSSSLPAGVKASVLAFSDDLDVGPIEPRFVWRKLASLPRRPRFRDDEVRCPRRPNNLRSASDAARRGG